MEKLFCGINDLAERYGVSRRTMYNLLAEEDAPPVMKLGGRSLVEVGLMDEWIRQKMTPSIIEQNKRRA